MLDDRAGEAAAAAGGRREPGRCFLDWLDSACGRGPPSVRLRICLPRPDIMEHAAGAMMDAAPSPVDLAGRGRSRRPLLSRTGLSRTVRGTVAAVPGRSRAARPRPQLRANLNFSEASARDSGLGLCNGPCHAFIARRRTRTRRPGPAGRLAANLNYGRAPAAASRPCDLPVRHSC